MDTLIAEDLLLLLLDDEKGTPRASSYLSTALGGAVLVDLALREAVAVDEKTSFWHTPKVRATTGASPLDPVLAAALATVAEKERSAQDLVTRLGKGLKETLTDRLVERGLVHRQDDKVLGVFSRTRWPAADATHEREVLGRVSTTLLQGVQPDPRTGALIALLAAVDQAHKVVDHEGLPAREVKKRAKAVGEGDWAAQAVRDAVIATVAAITAAGTAVTFAATGGS
ncbi:MAG: GPP34 family phosphoprotein [Nocardioides sp.]|nr:GPP34 family phosphoprotein [Nocardioides sp.]